VTVSVSVPVAEVGGVAAQDCFRIRFRYQETIFTATDTGTVTATGTVRDTETATG
jgi:hypothetical protein